MSKFLLKKFQIHAQLTKIKTIVKYQNLFKDNLSILSQDKHEDIGSEIEARSKDSSTNYLQDNKDDFGRRRDSSSH